MKILIVGSDKVYAIENYFLRHLQNLGVDVKLFPARSLFYDFYQSKVNKVIFRLGISNILRKINNTFKNVVEDFDPDVIWVFKGMELTPDSLQWVKQKGVKLANYNPDNPFLFSGRGSGNRNLSNSISLYDLHFTYSLSIQEQLKKAYPIKTALLPFGFELQEDMRSAYLQQEEVLKLCFLGNPDAKRAKFILGLASKGIEIDIYGNDWSKFLKHSNITIFPPVYGNDFWRVLYQYRVQLNLMRVHNEDSHNMRTFEVPGVGGILLAPRNREHNLYFEEGKEAFFFEDIDECVSIIQQLLLLTEEQSERIRTLARERCTSSGYSYQARTQEALYHLQNLYEQS